MGLGRWSGSKVRQKGEVLGLGSMGVVGLSRRGGSGVRYKGGR